MEEPGEAAYARICVDTAISQVSQVKWNTLSEDTK